MIEPVDEPSRPLVLRCRACGRPFDTPLCTKHHPLTCPACPAWSFSDDLAENGPPTGCNASPDDARPADEGMDAPDDRGSYGLLVAEADDANDRPVCL